jgi:hypothetical protein
MLKEFEPTTFPTEISPCCDRAALILTTNSGELVPNATIVRPIIKRLNPARREREVLPLTRLSAPAKRRRRANDMYARLMIICIHCVSIASV